MAVLRIRRALSADARNLRAMDGSNLSKFRRAEDRAELAGF
jgi:hypothetical protein